LERVLPLEQNGFSSCAPLLSLSLSLSLAARILLPRERRSVDKLWHPSPAASNAISADHRSGRILMIRRLELPHTLAADVMRRARFVGRGSYIKGCATPLRQTNRYLAIVARTRRSLSISELREKRQKVLLPPLFMLNSGKKGVWQTGESSMER